MADQVELLLTMTPAQQRELAENAAKLRRRFGTKNVTQTLIEAVRREAENGGDGERRKAKA